MSQLQKIKEITDKLEQGIVDLFQSDNYKAYLKTMSKFTSYSSNNTLLIAMQKPDATTVAGFSTWQKMDRHIIKGSKAIKILAPCPYRKKVETVVTDADGQTVTGRDGKPIKEQTEKVLMGFKIVNVFDYSQTEGEPLPEITHKLDGTAEGYKDFMDALQKASPVPIKFEHIQGPANGYYHLIDKNIVIDSDMSEIMHCKTGIHELAHVLLHDRDNGLQKDAMPDRETKEIQAESVAYTVCQYYGIDTSGYSFGYVAGWSSGRNLKELKSSLDVIRQTAGTIITGIDCKLDDIKQSRQMDIYTDVQKDMDVLAHNKPLHCRSYKH